MMADRPHSMAAWPVSAKTSRSDDCRSHLDYWCWRSAVAELGGWLSLGLLVTSESPGSRSLLGSRIPVGYWLAVAAAHCAPESRVGSALHSSQAESRMLDSEQRPPEILALQAVRRSALRREPAASVEFPQQDDSRSRDFRGSSMAAFGELHFVAAAPRSGCREDGRDSSPGLPALPQMGLASAEERPAIPPDATSLARAALQRVRLHLRRGRSCELAQPGPRLRMLPALPRSQEQRSQLWPRIVNWSSRWSVQR